LINIRFGRRLTHFQILVLIDIMAITTDLKASKTLYPKATSFHPIPGAILNLVTMERLEANDVLLYAFLRAHAFDAGVCHPSVETLSKLTRWCERTVQRSLNRLKEAGVIKRDGVWTQLLCTHKKGKGVVWLKEGQAEKPHIPAPREWSAAAAFKQAARVSERYNQEEKQTLPVAMPGGEEDAI
jgi:hypothetical protein